MAHISAWLGSMTVKSSPTSNHVDWITEYARIARGVSEQVFQMFTREKSIMHLSKLPRLFVLLVLVSQTTGCGNADGPPLGLVTGIVTLNDEPVPGVTVTFIPRGKGSPSYGATDENGEYQLLFNQSRAGAEVGTHDVVILIPEPATDENGNPIGPSPKVNVPAKYHQPGGLSVEVLEGENELDISLEVEPGL